MQSVWAIILWNNKILVAKRASSINNPNQWNLPGGNVEDEEDIKDALLREVYEETGLTDIFVYKQYKIKTKPKILHAFIVFVNVDIPTVRLNLESSKAKWITLDKLKKQIKNTNSWHHSTRVILKDKKILATIKKSMKIRG